LELGWFYRVRGYNVPQTSTIEVKSKGTELIFFFLRKRASILRERKNRISLRGTDSGVKVSCWDDGDRAWHWMGLSRACWVF